MNGRSGQSMAYRDRFHAGCFPERTYQGCSRVHSTTRTTTRQRLGNLAQLAIGIHTPSQKSPAAIGGHVEAETGKQVQCCKHVHEAYD